MEQPLKKHILIKMTTTAVKSYIKERKEPPRLPPEFPIFKKGLHRKENDIPPDLAIQNIEETPLDKTKSKKQRKLYSQSLNLNGELDNIRSCARGIEKIVPIKSNAPNSDEELYQIGPGYIGIHPSKNYVSVNGVDINVMTKFVNIIYGVKID